MAKTTELFSIPIYEVEFPNFEKTLKDPIKQHILSKFNSNLSSNYDEHEHPIVEGSIVKLLDTVSDDSNLNKMHDENMNVLADFLLEHCKEYWKILDFTHYLEPRILHLWAGIQKKGSRTVSHNHNPVPIGGVFYLESRPEQGNLLLENPLDLLLGKNITNANNDRVPNRLYHEVEAYTGKLVLFPGWMKHHTKGNPTDDVRIALAVNYGCQGQVYFTEFA